MGIRQSRGVSLVEAMVALAVMGFGMLAVVGVQSTLRLNADIAKQRSEATRIAQETVESRRSFAAIEGPGGYDQTIVSSGPTSVNGLITNATYSVTSTVVASADPPGKVLTVTVTWNDRAGDPQRVVLKSAIAAAAPGLSGTLAVRPGTAAVAPVRRPFGRHPSIPVQSRDLGNGSSAFVPPFRPWMAIVFNNVTGVVTGICNFNYDTSNDTITASDVADCSNTMVGQLLSGFVRFQRRTSGPELTAADVEDPPGPALNLRMQLSLSSSDHPNSPICIDDANAFSVGDDLPFATYFCVIYSNPSGLWSGISTVQPRSTFGSSWFISDDDSGSGPGAGQLYRVCRYTTAANDSQTIPNTEHPLNYIDVSGNLTNQNFVVIPAVKHCPTDVTANPSAGDLVNSNTLQHQPAPS